MQKLLAEDTHLADDAAARALYYEADGTAKAAGTVIANPALAATLAHDRRQGGAGVFYEGKIAHDIVEAVAHAKSPGDLSERDLASYRVKERQVLCRPYREMRVCGMGLPAGESVVLEILGLLQPFDLASHKGDTEAWHLFAAASRLAYADRVRFLGDPDFVKAPVEGLLDRAYLASAREADRSGAFRTRAPPRRASPRASGPSSGATSARPNFPRPATSR